MGVLVEKGNGRCAGGGEEARGGQNGVLGEKCIGGKSARRKTAAEYPVCAFCYFFRDLVYIQWIFY